MQFHLSGVGTAPGIAVRASRDLARNVVLEARGAGSTAEWSFGVGWRLPSF